MFANSVEIPYIADLSGSGFFVKAELTRYHAIDTVNTPQAGHTTIAGVDRFIPPLDPITIGAALPVVGPAVMAVGGAAAAAVAAPAVIGAGAVGVHSMLNGGTFFGGIADAGADIVGGVGDMATDWAKGVIEEQCTIKWCFI